MIKPKHFIYALLTLFIIGVIIISRKPELKNGIDLGRYVPRGIDTSCKVDTLVRDRKIATAD